MDQVAIKCQGIKKSYGAGETRIDALRGIDLEINLGELTMLVGPSGSGKSTLLSIITTILTPDEGRLILLDQEVSQMTENERAHFCQSNLGIVFQSLFLIPTLSVLENVSMPLLIAGNSQRNARKKALEFLDRVDLAARANVAPGNLSKGQQQKVAIVRAIVNEPRILVCDEPTSALDHTSGEDIMHILKKLASESSKAVLVVTHDHRIFSFADRIVGMSDGQLTPEAV